METNDNEGRGAAFIRGVCRFCGQALIVPFSDTQEEADDKATDRCGCGGALEARMIRERTQNAVDGVEAIFGRGAQDAGYEPVGAAALDFLKSAVALMAQCDIEGATVEIPGAGRARFSLTSKGSIKISRSETRTQSLTS